MNQTPTFSLLHASARPNEWREAFDAWMSRCDNPASVEYILAVDTGGPFDDGIATEGLRPCVRVVWNSGAHTGVAAVNSAARSSSGRVLLMVADDFFPCQHWDTKLLAAIPDLAGEYVVHVDAQDPWPELITHPIMTRAYYEKPGRGGCSGEFFYPEYESMGSDDDLTFYARRDGVVIDVRESIHFDHRNPLVTCEKPDAVYEHAHRAETWQTKSRVLAKRVRTGFGSPRKTLAIVTPGSLFPADWLYEWEKTFYSICQKFTWYRVYAESNNIYRVREHATRTALAPGVPDYVLWIDSDNPPRQEAFQALMAQLEASERNGDPKLPPIDIIGAWYRYKGLEDQRSYIAAGRSFGLRKGQLTEAEVLEAQERGALIQDLSFSGFGMLLMRGSVLADLGPLGFKPMPVDDERGYLDDDVSWCARARAAGHLIFLHPGAFVEHLKFGPVAPVLGEPARPIPISESKQKQLEEVAS